MSKARQILESSLLSRLQSLTPQLHKKPIILNGNVLILVDVVFVVISGMHSKK